jgi:hypothetical protein
MYLPLRNEPDREIEFADRISPLPETAFHIFGMAIEPKARLCAAIEDCRRQTIDRPLPRARQVPPHRHHRTAQSQRGADQKQDKRFTGP